MSIVCLTKFVRPKSSELVAKTSSKESNSWNNSCASSSFRPSARWTIFHNMSCSRSLPAHGGGSSTLSTVMCCMVAIKVYFERVTSSNVGLITPVMKEGWRLDGCKLTSVNEEFDYQYRYSNDVPLGNPTPECKPSTTTTGTCRIIPFTLISITVDPSVCNGIPLTPTNLCLVTGCRAAVPFCFKREESISVIAGPVSTRKE